MPGLTASRPRSAAKPSQDQRLWLGLFGVLCLLAYLPALSGEFVFDDFILPYFAAARRAEPLWMWTNGVRPVLMASFWVDAQLWGARTFGYHLTNLVLHLVNFVLVIAVVRHLLASRAIQRATLWATLAGALFLLHPLQTESVAYIAGRSELLSLTPQLIAILIMLRRQPGRMRWREVGAVLVCFALAFLVKEQAAVLPAVLLLVDLWAKPGGLKGAWARNGRLYGLLVVGGVAALAAIWRVLASAQTAGFAVQGMPWSSYAWTQCRVIWWYLRLFVWPYPLTMDYDYPVSHGPWDGWAGPGLVALLAVSWAAWRWRREWPLASLGWVLFLLLLAPTSSIVPLADPAAEHRTYAPLIGLALVAVDVLRRWRQTAARNAAVAAAVLFMVWATSERSRLWATEVGIWADTVEKSPRKWRAHVQLANAYYRAGNCGMSERHHRVAQAIKPLLAVDLVNWAVAAACLDRPQEAIQHLQAAAASGETAQIHSLLGSAYAMQGRPKEAEQALQRALELDSREESALLTLGHLRASNGDLKAAAAHYTRVLEINPQSRRAQELLDQVRALPTDPRAGYGAKNAN